jgi:hypothetical protein
MRGFKAVALIAAMLLIVIGALAAEAGARPVAGPAKASGRTGSVIMWYQAKSHIGEVKSVRGPVKGTMYAASETGKPTFLNIGKDYPSKQRFTVVIWGKYRSAFPSAPESYDRGKTVVATGKIRLYDGVAEMFIRSPAKLKVVN